VLRHFQRPKVSQFEVRNRFVVLGHTFKSNPQSKLKETSLCFEHIPEVTVNVKQGWHGIN